jgi:hypothetical protein
VPAFAASGGIDRNAMAAKIRTNHRNFIGREYRMKWPIAIGKVRPVEAERPGQAERAQFFLKLPVLRVVEFYRSDDSETKTIIRITEYLMTKTILLLAAVIGLASGVYAADPSPSASPGKKKTHHHHKTAAPSASPSATP